MNLSPIKNIPLIHPGDDLVEIVLDALVKNNLFLEDGDILVFAQKVISKSENRLFNLEEISPSQEAVKVAEIVQKDSRLIELILRESKKVIRCKPGTIIVEHKLGFICANAGIDHSNVEGSYGHQEDWVLLLPKNPDESAEKIRLQVLRKTGKKVGILIIDSHGRAWRLGVVGISIGLSGLPALIDMRGNEDIFGYKLKVTQIAVADELAAACSLVMGQAAEKIPVVHVRGFPYSLEEGCLGDLIRPEEQDLFR